MFEELRRIISTIWFDTRLFALLMYYMITSMAVYTLCYATFNALTHGSDMSAKLSSKLLGIMLSPFQVVFNFCTKIITHAIETSLNAVVDSINISLNGIHIAYVRV